ncbi:hypothetical protein [Streptomyces fragilis]|uniref:DUF3558 domain-containing protein n=1 Tax=Streptomyces fragilis TaxID=67301 RepID=A0ABV2YL41_9ACTN|nr:hypothetical protein [Streptomyces fragilis]
MQRKAYTLGIAALLTAVLAGCSGGPSEGEQADDSKPGAADATVAEAEPGRYRTLPEPCGTVGDEQLDKLLPGLQGIRDERKREAAYEGTASLTYDLDRQVGCRWQAESRSATSSLSVDFERVVSYEPEVGDDDKAAELFTSLREEAGVPAPGAGSSADVDSSASPSSSSSSDASSSPDASKKPADEGGDEETGAGTAGSGASAGASDGAGDAGSPDSAAAAGSAPRSLDELGEEAFLDDTLGTTGTSASQRTVTVVFRTSNVLVTVEYTSRPTRAGESADSEEMQDRAQELAAELAEELAG